MTHWPTQREIVAGKLRAAKRASERGYGDGWVGIETLCKLPGGGLIMEPHRLRIEMERAGFVIERRQRMRHPRRSRSYKASDWRLVSEPATAPDVDER